jgi:hypothetical protein
MLPNPVSAMAVPGSAVVITIAAAATPNAPASVRLTLVLAPAVVPPRLSRGPAGLSGTWARAAAAREARPSILVKFIVLSPFCPGTGPVALTGHEDAAPRQPRTREGLPSAVVASIRAVRVTGRLGSQPAVMAVSRAR